MLTQSPPDAVPRAATPTPEQAESASGRRRPASPAGDDAGPPGPGVPAVCCGGPWTVTARAGSLPPLSINTFRGVATALQNYVAGQIEVALSASGAEDQRYADRNIRHLLTHLPSRATFETVLDAALTT